jgi:hypothetical protein
MQNSKELWISQIYFPMENPMDRVHDAWTRQGSSGPPWIKATCDARALGLAVLTSGGGGG